jgi:PST family polysaccharide transporter
LVSCCFGMAAKSMDDVSERRKESAMTDLKGKAIRGGFAKVCAQAAHFILRVGSLMVFARLLDPKDFGLVGMVTAVTGVLNLFRDFGLSTVTVQRATMTDQQTSMLFWLNLLVGGMLGCLSLASAPILAAFYQEPRLFWVTVILSASFLFNAAGVQHAALLKREMRFTALATIEVLSLLTSSVVGIGMAFAGFGYWSLVGWSLVLPAANSAGAWLMTAWVPGAPSREVEMRSMMCFGGTVTLNGLIAYIAYNLDKVLLGRFWGTEALGIYGRAYQLISIPIGSLNSAVGEVAFSALSRVQEDQYLLKSYFLKGYAIVLTMTVPITIACALFADDLVILLLGPKWQHAAVIFRLMSPTVLVFALIDPWGSLLCSTGRVGRSLGIALVIAPLVIGGYVIGLPYGPNGVALGFSAMMVVWVLPHIAWCIKGTLIAPRDVWLAVSKPFLAGVVAGTAALALQLCLGQSLPPFVRFVVGGSALFGTYLWVLLWVMGQKSFYSDLLLALRKRPVVTAMESAKQ